MVTLTVFVEENCWSCAESRRLVAEFAPQFPQIAMKLIDVADHDRPDGVFAVPTFMLNGRIISLGNPYPGELRRKLQEVVSAL